MIHVLTDDESIGFPLETYILGLGYNCTVSERIREFQEKCQFGQPYYLLVDFLLAEGDCRHLLHDLLDQGRRPHGVLVMSGLPGFEDRLEAISALYTLADIPFRFLEKPFIREDLGELLFQLGQGIRIPSFGDPFEDSDVIHLKLPSTLTGKFGWILKAARQNLGLQPEHVVSIGVKKGIELTIERLKEIETDESGRHISCGEWVNLTCLLYERVECVETGFDPWVHLQRVRAALEDRTYPFPVTLTLQRGLIFLAKRERLEDPTPDLTHDLRGWARGF